MKKGVKILCMRRLIFAIAAAVAIAASITPARGLGRPGVTPIACPSQEWQYDEASFDALPGAKAFYGRYEGGLYRIEIPEKLNGELMLSAHGFVSNAGDNVSRLRVGTPAIRQHLIDRGFAWAASSYR